MPDLAPEYRCGRTLEADEGVGKMLFLVVLVVAAVVVLLVARAASSPGGGLGAPRPARRPRPPRPSRPARPLAPDDDPEFLRELDRRTRRDDGSPA